MGISGIGGSSSYFTQQINSASTQSSQLYTNLQKLKQQDPAKLQSTLADIADKLRTAALQASGPQAQKLNELADTYSQAAKTGDISQFKPGVHRGGGHHHHRSGGIEAASTSAASSSTSTTQQNNNVSSVFDSIFQEASNAVKS